MTNDPRPNPLPIEPLPGDPGGNPPPLWAGEPKPLPLPPPDKKLPGDPGGNPRPGGGS